MMAAGIYAVSFVLPACGQMLGYQAFLWSVIFIFCFPMWLANPVFWVGLACASWGEWSATRTYGLVALVLSLSEAWMFWGELAAGYFLWVGSMALLAVAGWCGCRLSPIRRPTPSLGRRMEGWAEDTVGPDTDRPI
jgi:hypothetical protein